MSTLTPIGDVVESSATTYATIDDERVGSCEKSWNNNLEDASDFITLRQMPYGDPFSGQLAEQVDLGLTKEESGKIEPLGGIENMVTTILSSESLQPRQDSAKGSPTTLKVQHQATGVFIDEKALNRLKGQNDHLGRCPDGAVGEISPRGTDAKNQQQKQKQTKHPDDSGQLQTNEDGSVSLHKVNNTDDSGRLGGGAVTRQKPGSASEKIRRRGKKKGEKCVIQTDSDKDQRGLTGTCSICGQSMEPGSKTVCKGCLNRQKSLLANRNKLDGQTLPSGVKNEDLYSVEATGTNSEKYLKDSEGISKSGKVENGRSASMETYLVESGGGEVYHRTLTDLQSQTKKWNSKVQPNFSEASFWEGKKRKLVVDAIANGTQIPPKEALKILCAESTSVESLNKDLKTSKLSHERGKSDDGSLSDLSHSDIYLEKKPEGKRRVGQREIQSRKEPNNTSNTKEEQHNVDGSNSFEKFELKGKLQRAKTDSEIARAVLEHEVKESQLGQDRSGNEETHQRTDKMPGKKLKRKTSSQSVDTGRGAQHKKGGKTKSDKITYGVENIQMPKALSRGKGHGYKSRVEGSTVATFRNPSTRDKLLGESKRVVESPSSDSTGKISNTSLATEKAGKKAFANLRSHTIIGGNMQRNRDIFLKKERRKEDDQQMPASVDIQVICENLPVADLSAFGPSSVDHISDVKSLSWYEKIEESDEPCDDSSEDENVRKVNNSEASSNTKDINKGHSVGPDAGTDLHFTDQSMEVIRNRSIPCPILESSPQRENVHDLSPVLFREHGNEENSDSNDEHSRPFQSSHRSLSNEQVDQEEENADSDYLNALASTSPVMSSRDIYYDVGQLELVNHEEQNSTSVSESESPLQESPYLISSYTYANPHFEFDDDHSKAIQAVEEMRTEFVDRKSTAYDDETDVDTGITTPSHRIRPGASPMRLSKVPLVDSWGQSIASASNSSNESNQASDERTGNWYTGGFFNDKARDVPSSDNSESMYFNDGQPKENYSDHDIYTGQVFSVAVTNHVNESALGFEGNKTLNSNVIPYELIVQNNNQNNSVRQQMHQLCGRLKSQELPHEGIVEHEGIWTKRQRWEIGDLCRSDCYWTLGNFSNNSNGKDVDYEDRSCPDLEQSSESQLMNSVAGSSYTEYDYDVGERNNIPRLQSSETSCLNFSRHEPSRRDLTNSLSQQTSDPKRYLKDVLFFGDNSNENCPTTSQPQESGLYFTSTLLPSSEMANAETSRQITLSYDSQDDDYYAMPNDKCNSNNSADCDEVKDNAFDDWYTGSVKNEEEFKPVFEKEFNTAPVVWPLHQTKVRDTTPDYFYQGSSDVKPYVSEDDCDYACEQKMKQKVRSPSPKPALLFKVGGIVVRNNVQDDADYAKNINMDLQEEPRPYVRYDIGEHLDDKADGTSYEKNIVYDDFTTSRPWEEDERAPWRITKGQNCGFNMEKSLEGAYDIKKTEKKLSKENGRSWGGLVNTNINAPGVVKYLGSYVTRWF